MLYYQNLRASWAAAIIALASGCGSSRPAAARLELEPGEPSQPGELSTAERTAILEAFSGLTAGAAARSVPGPARQPRWRDVPLAAAAACDEVEAAAFDTQEPQPGHRMVLVLRTVEGHPGAMSITRDATGAITAEAWFGRFPEEERHRTRAQALVQAFFRHLEGYGRKRGAPRRRGPRPPPASS